MLLRKTISGFFLTVFLLTNSSVFAWAEPQVSGSAAVLIDSKSGQILYIKDGDVPLPPASTTKILTAVLALENTKLTDTVTAGKNPSLVEPSAIGLREGETITMENLLYSLLVKSANDAGVAIAEHVAGSVPAFSMMMNQKARELGATNTNFVNPHGLTEPNHYTTARDLALIARHAMQIPEFRKFVSTKVKTIPRDNDDDIKWLQNSNKLLWRYEGANGIKTGYTREAKQCLVASAAREGQELIAVVLGSVGNNVWTDSAGLLDYGFANFDTIKLKYANTAVTTTGVKNGIGNVTVAVEKDFYYTVPRGMVGPVSEKTELDREITAPVKKGQVLGRIKYSLSGTEVGSVNLVAGNNVPVREAGVQSAVTVYPVLAGVFMLGLYMAWNVKKRRRRLRRKTKTWYRNPIR